MATINVDINATLEVDDDTWYEVLEACEGDEEVALQELAGDLEGGSLYAMNGEAWICFVEPTGFIDKPGKDRRFDR